LSTHRRHCSTLEPVCARTNRDVVRRGMAKRTLQTVCSLLAALSLASAGCNTASEGATAETPASAKQAGADVAPPQTAAMPTEKPTAAAGAVVGQPAPSFTLTDLDGKEHKLADYNGKVVVLEWFNPKCPFVRANHTE